jgi:hypothetical protein
MSTQKEPSAVRKALGELAPKLVELTDNVLFGDVWERPQLSKRDRSLITCAALVSTGKAEQIELAPLWWTSRKGLLSSEFRQCSREKIVQIHSRKTLSAA